MATWTNETIIKLIKEYKKAESLWNQNHENHKCKTATTSAWEIIATAVGGDVSEIKRKMKNLICQFYREYRKYCKLDKYEPGFEKTSKWFAYKDLSFLLSKKINCNEDKMYIHEETWSETDNNDVKNITLKNEIIPEEQTNIRFVNEPSSATTHTNPNHLPSRIHKGKKNVTKIFKKERNYEDKQNEQPTRSDSDIFGELVACKLKKLKTDISKNTAEHLISNILWEASLGKFDHLPLQLTGVSSSAPSSSGFYNTYKAGIDCTGIENNCKNNNIE